MIDSETVLADVLKLRVSQEALVERLAVVARAVSTRAAVLVLGGIRLKIEAGHLELAATDMELSLRTTLEAEIDGDGEVVVPGRLLLDIVRSLPAAEVSIEQRSDESVLVIEAGSASYRLHTYSAEDFPRLPELESVQLHAVDREALLETIGRVGRSASRDESRPVLTGILVQFEPGKLVMAATDSYRLAVKETPLDERRYPSSRRSSRPGRCRSWRASPPAPTRFSSACRRTTSSSESTARGSRHAGSTGSSRTTGSFCRSSSSTSSSCHARSSSTSCAASR